MYRLLIFGGTTEGRRLAEFCGENRVAADVSVTTEHGASLLPEGVGILVGRLGYDEMLGVIDRGGYSAVADATHPYAEQATANIRAACKAMKKPYYRLLRESLKTEGETADSIDQLIERLNLCGGVILSTLGSKSVSALTAVKGYRERVWLRMLPGEGISERCAELGFDTEKLILEEGPFDTASNILHIRKSGAGILLTKESGVTGGYPEKCEAARKCGIRLITLARPCEQGFSFEELTGIIMREKESGGL